MARSNAQARTAGSPRGALLATIAALLSTMPCAASRPDRPLDSELPCRRVAGVVYANGRPIAGATVEARSVLTIGDDATIPRTTTDDGGTFDLGFLPASVYFVVAQADGSAPVVERIELDDIEVGSVAEHLDLQLERCPYLLRGTIADLDGDPLIGARVEQTVPDLEFLVPLYGVMTDTEGQYELCALPQGEVLVSAAGYGTAKLRGAPREQPERLPLVSNLRLFPAARARGTVRSDDGTPLEGAIITATPADRYLGQYAPSRFTTLSGPDGRFAFDQLPPGSYSFRGRRDSLVFAPPAERQWFELRAETMPGPIELSHIRGFARGPDARASRQSAGRALLAAAVRRDPPPDLPRPGHLTGVVVDRSGRPVAGWPVRYDGPEGGNLGRCDVDACTRPSAPLTDRDGRFELARLPLGEYWMPPESRLVENWGTGPIPPTAVLTAARPAASIRVVVDCHRLGVIRGRVTYDDGRPAPHAIIPGYAMADDQGAFETPELSTDYVFLSAIGLGGGRSGLTRVDSSNHPLVLSVPRLGSIRGRIEGGCSGCVVRAFADADREGRRSLVSRDTAAGDDGSFVIEHLPAADYRVSVGAPPSIEPAEIEVTAGIEAEVALRRAGRGTVRGKAD